MPVELEFGDDADQITGDALGQLAQVGDFACRQQGFQGLLVRFGGGLKRQGDLLVIDLGKGEADGVYHIAFNILIEAVADVLLQAHWQLVVARAGGDNGVGQRGRQHGEFLDDGLGPADDITYCGVLHLGLDVGLQFLLRLGLGVFQQLRVETGRPAFGFVDGAAGDEALRQLFGVDAADGNGIQAFFVFVLLVAGINFDPGVVVLYRSMIRHASDAPRILVHPKFGAFYELQFIRRMAV